MLIVIGAVHIWRHVRKGEGGQPKCDVGGGGGSLKYVTLGVKP